MTNSKNVSVFFGEEDAELLRIITKESKEMHLSRSSYIKMKLSQGLQKENNSTPKSNRMNIPDLLSDL